MDSRGGRQQRDSRVAVFAFGTRGDVLPVAVVVAALAQAKKSLAITFITHAAHQNLQIHLSEAGVSFISISSPPVVPSPRSEGDYLFGNEITGSSDSPHKRSEEEEEEGWQESECWKDTIEHAHREECIAAMENVMGFSSDASRDFVIFNFFALEGWHLAELYRVPCAVVAPYVVPYSAPTSFERQFRSMRPLLYNRLQAALPGEVGWGEVLHWMWPLFTERWAAWRSDRLHLSPCPLTDPVTELPNIQDWPSAAPLLYGFSQDVVECPVYWPTSVFVCGFWYAPMDWEVSETGDIMSKCAQVEPRMEPSLSRCLETGLTTNGCPFVPPVKLHLFLSNERGQEQHLQSSRPPIFVGLSSIGSMGFMKNPEGMLKVLKAVLEATNNRAVLLTAAYPPLDLAIITTFEHEITQHLLPQVNAAGNKSNVSMLKGGVAIFNERLFCTSGSVPYIWLLPKCLMAIHHGGR